MKSAMVDWSSLPPDIIRCVGDCMLSTNDIDYYMDMRAVCCSWRTEMADPRQRGTDADLLLFRPRQWIMLDEDSEDEYRLFVNLSTGRFLRRRLPLLHDHAMVNTSDGLVILGENKYPHVARVLNPSTGSLVDFAMPIPHEDIMISMVIGSDPTLVFHTFDDDGDALWCADRTSKTFSTPLFPYGSFIIESMVAYAGNFYIVDVAGSIFKIVGTAQRCCFELVANTSKVSQFLVESAGELLLIRRSHELVFEIFRVDVDRNMLEAVESIGSWAIFLGPRSLSVDADKFPSVDGNCLYSQFSQRSKPGMYMYNLKDGRQSWISKKMPSLDHRKSFSVRPASLVQVLLGYCLSVPDVKAQVNRINRTRKN